MDKKISTARIRKNLEDLKAFTATPGKGCTRMPFSRETKAAAEYLKAAMKTLALMWWKTVSAISSAHARAKTAACRPSSAAHIMILYTMAAITMVSLAWW